MLRIDKKNIEHRTKTEHTSQQNQRQTFGGDIHRPEAKQITAPKSDQNLPDHHPHPSSLVTAKNFFEGGRCRGWRSGEKGGAPEWKSGSEDV